jgi:hypothetical protein
MVLKKKGLPTNISTTLATMWDSAIHMINTIYGTSSTTYTSTTDTPLYGPGQGSMCGPLFWLLCYWLIVQSIDPNITAATYISACQSVMTQITGVSFIHDTGLGVTSEYKWNETLSKSANW